MKTRDSGVPYMMEMYPDFSSISETIDFYEKILDQIYKENIGLKEKIKKLEEECHWLEAVSRKPTSQGEH